MSLFDAAKPRYSSGGYARSFGADLGPVLTKAQSTLITNGSDLESYIRNRCEPVRDVDDFLQEIIIDHGVWVAKTKDVVKATTIHVGRKGMPDLFFFKRDETGQTCYLVELKTGGAIDTKKARAEIRGINQFAGSVARHIGYRVIPLHCGFFCKTRYEVIDTYRGALNFQDSITGRELCDLLEIDYDEIKREMTRHRQRNETALLKELVSNPKICRKLKRLIV